MAASEEHHAESRPGRLRIVRERYHVARKVPFYMQFYMEGTILIARWYLSRPTRKMVSFTDDTQNGTTFHGLHAI